MQVHALIVYIATAVAILLIANRYLAPISRTAGLVLFLLPALFTGRALMRGEIYAPLDLAYIDPPLSAVAAPAVKQIHNGMLSDVAYQIIPWHAAVRNAWSAGEWPLWNPYMFAGDILAASAQPAPYYPFNLLSLLLPLPAAITFLASITLLNAAVGSFCFVRRLGCSEMAALFGAATWTSSDFLLFWNEWPLGVAASLLPLVLLAVRMVVRATATNEWSSVRRLFVLTFALVSAVLAGHPETTLHTVAIGILYGLAEMVAVRKKPVVLKSAGLALGAGALAFFITALYLLPIIEALPQTAQHTYRRWQSQHRSHALTTSESTRLFKREIVPFTFGFPSSLRVDSPPDYRLPGSYAGSIALGLAAIGIAAGGRSSRWPPLMLLLIGWLASSRAWPLLHALEGLPLFDIALNERLVMSAIMGLSVFAAFGVDALVERRRQSAIVFLVVAVVATLVSLGVEVAEADFVSSRRQLLVAPLILAALVIAKGQRFTIPLLLGLMLVQRAGESGRIYPTLPAETFYPPAPEIAMIPRGDEPARFVATGSTFPPNIATLYKLEDVRAYQAITLQRWLDTYRLWCEWLPVSFNRVDDLSRPFLSALNVRYALHPKNEPLPAGWKRLGEGPTMQVAENLNALPRAYLPRTVRLSTEHIDTMHEVSDFGEVSWIAARRQGGGEQEVNGRGKLITRRKGHGLEIRADISSAAWIVISEAGWKGWRATIDGKPARIYTANHALLAVRAPAGRHVIRLRYLPQSFVAGRWLTLIGFLMVVAIAFWNWRANRRRTEMGETPALVGG